MDFIATEALTNIYLYSVRETIEKLEELSLLPVDTSFNVSSDAAGGPG